MPESTLTPSPVVRIWPLHSLAAFQKTLVQAVLKPTPIKVNDGEVLTPETNSSQLSEVWLLKGQCHEIDIFLKVLKILISTFCVCADGFQGLKKLSLPYTIINFLFASLKLLTNFENGD
jgi:hypothetical protein